MVKLTDCWTWSATCSEGGAFTQLSVRGDRVAGRLRDGRAAILNLASGRFVAGRRARWPGSAPTACSTSAMPVLDSRLRVVRRVQTSGALLTVAGGAAYFGDGETIRRLRPGASRATSFAKLPGNVIGMAPAKASPIASGTRVNRVPNCP